MKLIMLATLIDRLSPHLPVFAQTPPRVFDEMGVGAAILLTVLGMTLHWRLPGVRMSAEENVKDSKMTEEQAHRRLRFYTRCASIATLFGVGVLIAVMFDLAQ
jgi:hypothetical protein